MTHLFYSALSFVWISTSWNWLRWREMREVQEDLNKNKLLHHEAQGVGRNILATMQNEFPLTLLVGWLQLLFATVSTKNILKKVTLELNVKSHVGSTHCFLLYQPTTTNQGFRFWVQLCVRPSWSKLL